MGKHILLVEDEEQTRNTFKTILEAAGYEVTACGNGHNALREVFAMRKAGKSLDMLVTDIRMIGLDGLQLIDQLHKLNIRVPALAMTGYSDKDLVVDLIRVGCLEYIEKPFEAAELVERIGMIFKKTESQPA